MASTYIKSGTPVQQPTTQDVGQRDQGLFSDHLFAQAHTREVAEFVTEQFPQYNKLSTFLGKIGRRVPTIEPKFEWIERGRTRIVAGLTDEGADGSAAKIIKTDIARTATTGGYFIVGDTVNISPENILARVTTVEVDTGIEKITIEKLDGTVWAAADITTSSKLSHFYNLQVEGATAPVARQWGGEFEDNLVSVGMRSIKVSDIESASKAWSAPRPDGKKYWWWNQEMTVLREIVTDKELLFMHGIKTSATFPNAQGGFGVLPRVKSLGVFGNFSGPVTEEDIIDHATELSIHSPAEEFLVLYGSQFGRDAAFALRDYAVGGGVQYGTFSTDSMKSIAYGLGISQYKFNDKVFNFMSYPAFNDPQLNPNSDLANTALFLNMGDDENGEPLFRERYLETTWGEDLSLKISVIPGLISPTSERAGANIASSREAAHEIIYYYSTGLELRAANQHGLMQAS